MLSRLDPDEPAEVVDVVDTAFVVAVVELGVVVAVVAVVEEAAGPEVVVVVPEPVLELLQLAANPATATKAAPAMLRRNLKFTASFIVIWTPFRVARYRQRRCHVFDADRRLQIRHEG